MVELLLGVRLEEKEEESL